MNDKSRVSFHLRRLGVVGVAGPAWPDGGAVGVVGDGLDTLLRSVGDDDHLANGLSNCLGTNKEGGRGLQLLLVNGDPDGLN